MVPLPTVEELHDTIAVRMLLEPPALRMAAKEFGPKQVQAINKAIEGEVAAAPEANPLRFAQANEAFRVAIFGTISNRILRKAISQFDSHLHFIRASTLKDLELRTKIIDRQSHIRDAIAAQDSDLAEGLWKSYLRLTEDSLLAALKDWVARPASGRRKGSKTVAA
jgi:DNA-binding GntR family transcriptional regulator